MSAAWPTVSLGELIRLERRPVDVVADHQYQEIGTYSYGRGIFHKTPRSGLEVGNKDLFQMKEGDLILQITFAWEGAIALCSKAEDGLFGSVRYPTFRVDDERCFAPFLVKYLTTREGLEQIVRICPGSAGRNRVLALKRLPEVMVPLPPRGEQCRIVARIEELAAKVNEARGLRSSTQTEIVAALMSTRRALIGEIPTKKWAPLSKHVAEIENGKSPATDGRVAEEHEWAVLKVGAVSFGSFDEKENKALPPSFKPFEQYEVAVGDFLMSRANTAELVGACAIVRATRPRLMLSDKIFRFKFKPTSDLVPEYLDHALKSPVLRTQIVAAASGTSPTMKNISKGKVLSLLIPDVPASEQRHIVTELDAIQSKLDTVKALQSETAAELNAMLPAILDKAFKGELV